MADNITLNAGTGGASLATDDVGGVQYQRVKQTFGADGSATDVAAGAGLPVAGSYVELTGSAAANNTDVIAATDVRAYRWFSLQLAGTFTAQVRVQGSNDGTNYVDLYTFQVSSTAAPVTSIAGTGLYQGPVSTRYLRVRTTAYTSGTVVGTLELTANPGMPSASYVSGVNGTLTTTVTSGPTAPTDAMSNQAFNAMNVFPLLYNGASWDRLRTPNVFKTVQATSLGNNTLWTPAAGKKFRLMKYRIMIPNGAIGSANSYLVMQFKDATSNMPIIETCFLTTTATNAAGNTWTSGLVDLGGGYLSSGINQALILNLNYALTDGDLRVLLMGIEE